MLNKKNSVVFVKELEINVSYKSKALIKSSLLYFNNEGKWIKFR